MLSEERAMEMEVVGPFPTRLKKPCFTEKKVLWNKQTNSSILPLGSYVKKYEYFKIGKTFGFQTTRYLACSNNCLFYYDEEADKEYKGYCEIENVYVQWLQLKNGKFMLYLGNGNEESLFYFNTAIFWKDNESIIARSLIQLNFKQKYQTIEQIGKGSFSKVYRVRHLGNKQEFAAKVVNKTDKNKTSTKNLVMQERKILRLIDSPYVYKFEEMFEEEESYVFVLEYLPGKDLMSLYKQKKLADPQIAIFLLRKILQGIRDIHNAGVIHRDLKPQNIIVNLDTLHPSIIDFGLSLHLDKTVTDKNYKRCGTMGYMAPEVIENTGEGKKNYGLKCDLFSFGIIAHMLLLGFNPLKGDSYDETFLKNKACDFDLNKKDILEKYGENGLTFLSRLLARLPQLRYDAYQALKSSFLKQKDKQQSSSTVEQKRKGIYQSTKNAKE